jgi:hypothetical protein
MLRPSLLALNQPGISFAASLALTRPCTVAVSAKCHSQKFGNDHRRSFVSMLAFACRCRRRCCVLQVEAKRNDAPFFAALALLVVLPPAIILGAAYATGFLDTLAATPF